MVGSAGLRAMGSGVPDYNRRLQQLQAGTPNVSKNDTHFFNVFSVVLGILVTFAILMFALARYVGKHEQNAQVLEEPMLQDSVQARIAPPVRVAVAGQDNTALKIEPVANPNAAVAVLATFKNGTEVFEGACKACHGLGIAGAPKAGDAHCVGAAHCQGQGHALRACAQGLHRHCRRHARQGRTH